MKSAIKSGTHMAAVLAITLGLTACSTTQNAQDEQDPFEGFNRTVFKFNDKVDRAALQPVARAYRDNLPSFVQVGVANFFGNLNDIWTAANHLLQGNLEDGLSDGMRFAVNSTMGFAGLLDIASEAGLQKHNQDFGATLGVWGVPPGPYLVLPFVGPSTVRDTAALPVDYQGDLWADVNPDRLRYSGSALRVVDQRASFLGASNLLEDIALDRYEFVKDGFLQRRAGKIEDAKSPYRPAADDAEGEDQVSRRDEGVEKTAAPAVKSEPAPAQILESSQTGMMDAGLGAIAATPGPDEKGVSAAAAQ